MEVRIQLRFYHSYRVDQKRPSGQYDARLILTELPTQ
jgi:hypothetical protein